MIKKFLYSLISVSLSLQIWSMTAAQGQQPTLTPDLREADARRAYQEGALLLQEGTAASLRTAKDKFETARTLSHLIGNKEVEAVSLVGLGSVSDRAGNSEAGLQYFHQALALFREIGHKQGEAASLNNIGLLHQTLGRPNQALEYYKQALPLRLNLVLAQPNGEAANGAATTLHNLGQVYLDLGDQRNALDRFKLALIYWQFARDIKGMATTLNGIGIIYRDIGDHQEALKYHNEALRLSTQGGDRSGEATSLGNIGMVYSDLGDTENALAYYNEAWRLSKAVDDRSGLATRLNNIGSVYDNLGEKKKALEYYNQALLLKRALNDKRGEATVLNNIGSVYSQLGDNQKALDYYQEALSLARAVEDKGGEATTLNNVGVAYDDLGEKQKALEYYNLALMLKKAVNDKRGEGAALNNIGNVYDALGEQKKALTYYLQALPVFQTIADRRGQATTLNNIGAAASATGGKKKAIEYYNQAFLLFGTTGDRKGKAMTLSNMMFAWLSLNNPRLAVFFGKQAVNLYQELRHFNQGLDQKTQRTYLQSVSATYRTLADVLIQQGRLPEAQWVLSLLKDEEYFEFVQRDKNEIAALAKGPELNNAEKTAFAEYAELADDLTAIGARYQMLFDKRSKLGGMALQDATEEAEFQKLSQQLTTTSDTFQRFLDRLAGEFAKSAPGANIQIARISDLQSDLREVGPDVVLVSTFVLPDRYRVILTTGQTQVDHKTEIKVADLNRKLNCFSMALHDPRVDPRPLGKELYDILVKPLEGDLEKGKFKTILWSLDGTLRYIPVAALWDGQHYLAERYQNTVITLGRNSRLFKDVNHDWRALGAGVSTKWPGFAELTAVKTELRSIVRDERVATETEGVLPGRRLLDGEFKEGTLKDLLPSLEKGRRFNLIHLASHFKLRQTRDTSFLLLGDGTELSLTKFDTDSQLKMTGVELLTLSACETGVGVDQGDGSEVESFGMLAEKNGAKAVMATLWRVADCSTGEFMRKFYSPYQQGRQQGVTKAAALQQAQQAMLSGAVKAPTGCQAHIVSGAAPDVCAMPRFTPDPAKPFAHPYFWAPFVLFGNWR